MRGIIDAPRGWSSFLLDNGLMLAPPDHEPERPLWQRLAWMAGIWAMSVTALGAVAWMLRLWLNG